MSGNEYGGIISRCQKFVLLQLIPLDYLYSTLPAIQASFYNPVCSLRPTWLYPF